MLEKLQARQLYFVAIVPPSPVYDEALSLKHHFKDQYNSKASLNSPPHITLHMPFQWKKKKELILMEVLRNFSQQHSPLNITLNGFNCFEPRVIYIAVEPSDKLEKLQRELHRVMKVELNLFNANYQNHPFHPHLTIAFRDLRKENFRKAWEEFKDRKFDAVFTVSAITLLKHDGKMWQEVQNFLLSGKD